MTGPSMNVAGTIPTVAAKHKVDRSPSWIRAALRPCGSKGRIRKRGGKEDRKKTGATKASPSILPGFLASCFPYPAFRTRTRRLLELPIFLELAEVPFPLRPNAGPLAVHLVSGAFHRRSSNWERGHLR